MLRATISVREATQLLMAYELIHNEMPFYKIVKVQNNLTSPLQNVVLNFVYRKMIIGEIQLQYGGPIGNQTALTFLSDLSKTEDMRGFKWTVLQYCNDLAEKGAFYKDSSVQASNSYGRPPIFKPM